MHGDSEKSGEKGGAGGAGGPGGRGTGGRGGGGLEVRSRGCGCEDVSERALE